ncbi:DUF5998 family protein [Actinomyces trachealis]|uniref:DUF5998 family protein n=1 Tax=Actinomyces trachealis TaxID=2763540 RepID=UPI001F405AAA|nr:DUF5998 family protein [Actinomyces trachealis]
MVKATGEGKASKSAKVQAKDGAASTPCSQQGSIAWGIFSQEVRRAAFYPDLVLDTLGMVLAGEALQASLVQSETTIEDAVHRHLTVLALTTTRLVIVHVDDVPGEGGHLGAVATSEAVSVSRIHSVSISRAMRDADKNGGQLTEMTIAAAWGAVRRMDFEPAGCPDPNCQADHGLTGVSVPDDIVMRVAAGVEGIDALAKAEAFARALSRVTAQAAGARL